MKVKILGAALKGLLAAVPLSGCGAVTSVEKLDQEVKLYRIIAHGSAFQRNNQLREAIGAKAEDVCGPSKASINYDGPLKSEEIETYVNGRFTKVHAYTLGALIKC
ncbi:hypothetical protein [Allohahella marinimesophila]|uniref:Lipoprotein n=1 Tax=Allohahella marinimesophila TaxID=1054972 RepID=A0ABP7P5X6_9GAMM